MKITLISPPFGEYVKSSKLMSLARLDEIQKSEGLPIAPPVLEYLAGLTEKVATDREKALLWFRAEAFSNKRILKRLWSLSFKGFPMTHITPAMMQIPMGRAFREIREGNPYV